MNAKTTSHTFGKVSESVPINLFSVNEGVPVVAALERASCYLATIRDLLNKALVDPDCNCDESPEIWGIDALILSTKALVDSSVSGLINQKAGDAEVSE